MSLHFAGIEIEIIRSLEVDLIWVQTESDVQKYKTRVSEVEVVTAERAIASAKGDWSNMPSWLRDEYNKNTVMFIPRAILINIGERNLRADFDDYIVRQPSGRIDCYKPADFEALFEPA